MLAPPPIDSAEDARLAAMLREELRGVRPDLAIAADASLRQVYAAIGGATPPLSALCLSGGGIRSAAFALGVLQTLARYGVLDKFDYLSTVSGGGYIGSFLTAWRKQANNDPAVLAGLDRGRAPDGVEAPEIAGLRDDSNYLTPKLGMFSADTWTVAVLVIRNLLLNWVVFLPFFMGVLLVPWACKHALDALNGGGAWPWLVAGVIVLSIGLGCASYGRRRAEDGWLTDGRFVICVLVPIVIAAMGFSAAAAGFQHAHPDRIWLPARAAIFGAVGGLICYALAWVGAGFFRPEDSAQAGHPKSEDNEKDLGAWLIAGIVAGIVLQQGVWAAARWDSKWLTLLGISWTMLSIFVGELVYIGLRSYSVRGDMDREWLARAAGWLGAWAVTWALIAGVALAGPHTLTWVTHSALVAAGGVSGAVTLALGSSGQTAATTATNVARRLSLTQLASIAGVIFSLVLAIEIAQLDVTLGQFVIAGFPAWGHRWLFDAAAAALLIGFSAGASWFINVNRFSLHAVYRNRLVRAFLGSARRGRPLARRPDPFTNFDPADNPRLTDVPARPLLHVLNVALNIVSTDNLAWQERKAESFTMTALHCGNPLVGYKPTRDFGSQDGGVTLGTAMAISGAAVSPNMGYNSSPLVGVLLMLFNVRLGWWLGNPNGPYADREGPTFSLFTMLLELANQTTAKGRWIYLSDGGHFDNLGIYEMVRRRCRFVVVSDAGCDPDASLADLGNAVRKASIDFGVRIRFDSLDISVTARPPLGGASAWLGSIYYPGSAEPGWLLYLRPTYKGDEAADIRSYAQANPTFPHESTSEQWFGESQFEAYRALGAHQMEQICCGAGDLTRAQPMPIDLAGLRRRAEEYFREDIGPGGDLD